MIEAIKWEPVHGRMDDQEAKTLGISPLPGRSYHALWPFGVPLICQRDHGVWSILPRAIQERAMIGAGFKQEAMS